MSKELWFDEFERRRGELEDQGVDPDKAYDMAGQQALGLMRDRLADAADNMKKEI